MFGNRADISRLRARKEAVLHRTQKSRVDSRPGSKPRRKVQIAAAVAATVGILGTGLVTGAGSPASAGVVGSGFTVTASDLAFILKQIKIAERHVRSIDNIQPGQPVNPHLDPTDPLYDPEYCGSLIGPNADQIPDALTSYGLRLVDGGCNNLVQQIPGVNGDPATPGVTRPNFARADQAFPRLTAPMFRPAEGVAPDQLFTGSTGVASSTYAQKSRKDNVYDSQPRVISNLIIDQTSANPAAVVASNHPVRTQDPTPSNALCLTNPYTGKDVTPLTPIGCVPQNKTLFIPNVTTDVGLSPPYNALFTFFGQFFDHGVDQTVKSGASVIIPLNADDPLVLRGPDGIAGNADDLKIGGPNGNAFMSLPRAQNQPGPDGVFGTADDIQNANNTDTPWVDQSQTYTSHPGHQVFLREYTLGSDNKPHSTGKFLDGLGPNQTYPGSPDGAGGIGTWAATKLQAATKLGLALKDTDISNVPMVAADPYGNFIPGPARGLPMWVTAGPDGKPNTADDQMIEGNLASPVPTPADVLHFDVPFLTDVNGTADPGTVGPCETTGNAAGCKSPDSNTTVDIGTPNVPDASHYDDELLNSHFICGDGRCNENIALSTVHQIFHSEHNRLVDDEQNTLNQPGNEGLKADYLATNCPSPDCTTHDPLPALQTFTNGERMFQAARFVTEMEYQHLVFEEFARKIQPAVRPFHVYNADINSAIPAEYAHAIYRFGHSMLNDEVARQQRDASNNLTDSSVPLLTAFLNPPLFFKNTSNGSTYTAQQAAGAIVMGTSDQTGNELDEFVADTLRNNLVGQPLDLPTLNIARGRDTGIPPLNVLRRQIFAATNDGQLTPYTSWSDFGQHLKHAASLINFVAAYGTHPTITSATTLAAKRAAARAIVDPQPAVSASPGPDGQFGTNCTSLTPDPTCYDDTLAAPADVQPADAFDFMMGQGAWANQPDGTTITGLDNVDAWIGGLA